MGERLNLYCIQPREITPHLAREARLPLGRAVGKLGAERSPCAGVDSEGSRELRKEGEEIVAHVVQEGEGTGSAAGGRGVARASGEEWKRRGSGEGGEDFSTGESVLSHWRARRGQVSPSYFIKSTCSTNCSMAISVPW